MVTYQIFSLFALMGRKKNQIPSRLYHKPSGQDRVIFGSRTIYLGPHDSAESLANYAKVLANIAATGDPEPQKKSFTIAEVASRYMDHVLQKRERAARVAALLDAARAFVMSELTLEDAAPNTRAFHETQVMETRAALLVAAGWSTGRG